MLPPRFPPCQAVYNWSAAWRGAGIWQSITHHLMTQDCERVSREATSSAAVIDRQSVKTIGAGGPRGYDAGKLLGAQAPCHGRYRWAAARAAGASRLRAGPWWRRAAAYSPVDNVGGAWCLEKSSNHPRRFLEGSELGFNFVLSLLAVA